MVLQPLLAAGVFTFVFGKVAHLKSNGVPYFIFAFAGMITWNASHHHHPGRHVDRGQQQHDHQGLLPRVCCPVGHDLSLIDAVVALAMMMVLLGIYGVAFTWKIVTFPLWLGLAFVLSQGVGIASAAMTVRFRDVQYVLPVTIQFLLYASPVAYGVSSVPKSFRIIDQLNPLTGLLEGTRRSLSSATRASIPTTRSIRSRPRWCRSPSGR